MELLELKNIITEIKKQKQKQKISVWQQTERKEERVSELEDRTVKITQPEKQREKRLK